jgi:hypothetical protein
MRSVQRIFGCARWKGKLAISDLGVGSYAQGAVAQQVWRGGRMCIDFSKVLSPDPATHALRQTMRYEFGQRLVAKYP